MSDDEQNVSFYIKDMYSPLAKYDVLSEIKNRINNRKSAASIDKYVLIELAVVSLEFMSFTIDQKYCNQNQGLFISVRHHLCRIKEWNKSSLYNVKRPLSMVQRN